MPPSSASSGSSGSRTRAQLLQLRPTHRPRRPRRQVTRRLLNRKCHLAHRNRCLQSGKTWCFQRLRSATAWRRTSAWKARSPLSTTTSIRMWIASTRWWPTTTAVAGVSVIAAARWKVRDGMLSRTGVNFRLKAGADSLAHPLARCRRLHRPVLHRMQRYKPSSASSTNSVTKLAPLMV